MVISSTADTINSHTDQAADENIAGEAGSATRSQFFLQGDHLRLIAVLGEGDAHLMAKRVSISPTHWMPLPPEPA